jgi:hypothetical protein
MSRKLRARTACLHRQGVLKKDLRNVICLLKVWNLHHHELAQIGTSRRGRTFWSDPR